MMIGDGSDIAMTYAVCVDISNVETNCTHRVVWLLLFYL